MSDERKDRQLDDVYRRASAADAGRPDAKLRAAILAGAAESSRRRMPAANESRYALRAVAGVAVVGLALLIWQQARHEVPRESVASEAVGKPQSQSPPAEATQALPGVTDAAPAPDAGAPRVADAPGAGTAPGAADAQARAPRQEPPRPPAREELSEVMVTGTRVTGQRTAPGPAITAAEAMALLRRHFPREYQSPRPHRLWLVLDAAGRQFEGGELTGTQQLRDIEALVGRLAGAPEPWQVHVLTNARGQSIELAIAHSRL